MKFKMQKGYRASPGITGQRTHMLAEVEMHGDGTGTLHTLDGNTVMADGPSVESVPEGPEANQVPMVQPLRHEFRMPGPGDRTRVAQAYAAKMREGNYQETENT